MLNVVPFGTSVQLGTAQVTLAGKPTIVRIPVGQFALASRVLDFGVAGVIAPMINNVASARAFVSATKYPPLGERSWGPTRGMALAGVVDPKQYLREANAATVTLAMIETREAMKNLDAIAATPGIDILFVGPSDLSIALSDGADLDAHSAAVEAALDQIVAACRKAGINVPIIPGLKPITSKKQLSVIPRTFNVDIPTDLSNEILGCKTDTDVEKVGTEWLIAQSKELKAHKVPVLHYYTLGKPKVIYNVARELF